MGQAKDETNTEIEGKKIPKFTEMVFPKVIHNP